MLLFPIYIILCFVCLLSLDGGGGGNLSYPAEKQLSPSQLAQSFTLYGQSTLYELIAFRNPLPIAEN